AIAGPLLVPLVASGPQALLHLHFQDRLHRLLHHRNQKILLFHQNRLQLCRVHGYVLRVILFELLGHGSAFHLLGLHTSSGYHDPLLFAELLKHYLISDSVLVTLDTSHCKDYESLIYWLVFAVQCSVLWDTLFAEGLPLRGVITHGSFIVHETCWAGQPIIAAYKLAESLNLAGCVLTKEAKVWIELAMLNVKTQNDVMYFSYSIPLNTGDYLKGDIFNVSLHKMPRELEADIRQNVHRAFWAHRKHVSG